jgi:formylglycine-generating enzyme required for sulfatase activity
VLALCACQNGLTPESIRDGGDQFGSIQVNSTPTGATVWLDTVNTGQTTNCLLENVAVGQHTVKLTLSGYADWYRNVAVTAGQTTTAETTLVASGPDTDFVYLGTNAQGFEEYLFRKDSAVMIRVPAGTFTMGSDSGYSDEQPVHPVYLDEYYVDKYEVTNRQYKRFCGATGRGYPPDPGFPGMSDYFTAYPSYPVVDVSWNDAQAYCTWAGKALPTEAEWEKAARGTDARKYPWGNAEPNGTRCNIHANNDGYDYTSPVGNYPDGVSPYGCMDMAGNVWEWCNDWYASDYYGGSPGSNPQGPSSGSYRVFRGGSWYYGAWYLRCSNRLRVVPSYRNDYLGFRCAAVR